MLLGAKSVLARSGKETMHSQSEKTNQPLHAQTPAASFATSRTQLRRSLPFTLLGLVLIGALLWQANPRETLDHLRHL